MFISEKEFEEIMSCLALIDSAEKRGKKKNYITNKVRLIRLVLNKADRRSKNTLL